MMFAQQAEAFDKLPMDFLEQHRALKY